MRFVRVSEFLFASTDRFLVYPTGFTFSFFSAYHCLSSVLIIHTIHMLFPVTLISINWPISSKRLFSFFSFLFLDHLLFTSRSISHLSHPSSVISIRFLQTLSLPALYLPFFLLSCPVTSPLFCSLNY